MNTNYDSLITNDKWIFKRYAVFYMIDDSLHNNDVWKVKLLLLSYCYLLTVKHLLRNFVR